MIRYPNIVKKYPLTSCVFLSGIAFMLYLLSFIQGEMFFSGDGGLKAIIAKQLAQGTWRFDLDLQAEPWAIELWNQGYYPFTKPFVHFKNAKLYTIYPFSFPLLTAPFYALFGWYGLYILPPVSISIFWVVFIFVMIKCEWPDWIMAIILAALIYSTPITLYGATFWEHPSALAFGFTALVLTVFSSIHQFKWTRLFISGFFVGIAIWLRPEFWALAGLLLIYIVMKPISKLNYKLLLSCMLGFVITISCYIVINLLLFNIPLGPHATLVTNQFSFTSQLDLAYRIFIRLWSMLTLHFPIIWFVFALLPFLIWQWKFSCAKEILVLYSIALLFLIISSFLLPTDGGFQWGPRFWLLVMPILLYPIGWGMHINLFTKKNYLNVLWKIGILTIFAFYFYQGMMINSWSGSLTLIYKYQDILTPTLEYLDKCQEDIVIVQDQSVCMELEALLDTKTFFRATAPEHIADLISGLIQLDKPKFLFITFYPVDFDTIQNLINQQLHIQEEIRLHHDEPARYGTFLIYHLRWDQVPT